MLPVLFTIGPLKIYTLGVFLVLAFFWGSFLLWRLIRLSAYKEEEIFDCLFLSLMFGLFFSRLFYVAGHFSQFGFDLLKFILINGYPGLSWLGGLMGGFFFAYLFFSAKKIPFLQVSDYFIPPLFLALGFGFLGIFFSQKNSLLFVLIGLIFFFSAFLSYRVLFLIRQERLRIAFNLFIFLLITGLVGILIEKGSWYWFSLILLLTSGGYILYYFRVVIFKSLKELFEKIYHYEKKLFPKRVRKDKN